MAGDLYQARVRDLLADAAEQAEQGHWDAVKALAGAALALDPDDADALRLHAEAEQAGTPAGERRQLTVMFCDIVGSTALTQQRDPELVGEVLRSYQSLCDTVVRRYGARVARYIGDGVLVYFGHPEVHEDDARRAVQAGLDLIDAMRPLSEEVERTYGLDLRVRVAVHTGVVVRAEMGSAMTPDRDAIVGETPNLAARLQDHAAPGTLMISGATYDLVRGWFLVAPAGDLDLKGIDRPVAAYEVIEPAPTESRLQAQADLSPFVGRAEVLDQLQALWADVEVGEARSAALTGPPGVGKSRVADVLRRRIEETGGTSLSASCSMLHRSTALHPVRRLLERSAGITAHVDGRGALTRLWSHLDQLGMAERLPLLADLLELPPEPWCPAPELDGAKLREEVLLALVEWIRHQAARVPLLLLVDDHQWADPSTVELVGRLLSAKVPGLLLLLTVRDDATVPWSAPTRIELDRLSLEELSQLARRLPEARNLDPTDLERAVERSDGIPLFLEELVRSSSLAQAGAGSDGPTSIPPALRDLLLARFAAPGVDLRFVQLLATIGADLTRDVVVGASSLPVAEVDEQLRRLVEQRILALAEGEEDAYRFHHQLLVDLAYETQLLPARRRAHSSVADALLQSGLAALDPAVTSHHLEQADRIAEAIGWACTAAERSVSLGAQAEAGGVLDHAFALLDQVAPDERPALEFEVRLLRGVTVAGTLGYAAPQAVSDFQASLDLVKLLDREVDVEEAGLEAYFSQERIWSSVGLWATFLLQGRLADADEVLLGLMAPLAREGFLYRYWNGMRGFVDFFAGDYAKAEPLLREAVAGLEQISMPHRISIPHDPLASAQVHLAFVCAIRCEFEESRELIDRALARARSLPFPRGPFTVCYVAGMGAAIELFLGDPDRSLELVGEQMALAERHGFTFWTIVSGFYLAMMDAYEGDPGAMVRAEMSVMLLQGIGVECWLPMFHEALAACFELAGDLEGASRALDEALRAEERLGIHHWGAESLRLRGAIRLRQGDRGGLDDLRAAIDLAVAQGAVLHEAWARQALCDQVDDPAEHEALAHVVVSLGDRAVGLHEVNASMAGLSKR